jgi:hypothetical protein
MGPHRTAWIGFPDVAAVGDFAVCEAQGSDFEDVETNWKSNVTILV